MNDKVSVNSGRNDWSCEHVSLPTLFQSWKKDIGVRQWQGRRFSVPDSFSASATLQHCLVTNTMLLLQFFSFLWNAVELLQNTWCIDFMMTLGFSSEMDRSWQWKRCHHHLRRVISPCLLEIPVREIPPPCRGKLVIMTECSVCEFEIVVCAAYDDYKNKNTTSVVVTLGAMVFLLFGFVFRWFCLHTDQPNVLASTLAVSV